MHTALSKWITTFGVWFVLAGVMGPSKPTYLMAHMPQPKVHRGLIERFKERIDQKRDARLNRIEVYFLELYYRTQA